MTLPAWSVLLPPLCVIACVITTRRMILSFLVGIISSALLVTQGNILDAITLAGTRLWFFSGLGHLSSISRFLESMSLLIFIFLLCLGVLIEILGQSGSAQAYIRLVKNKVTTKKRAESASLILSFFFFIDDYFSALTVGSVMRPLALLHNVHPVKLAFLTTAMATPLTIVSPISSWVGEIVLQLKQVGIGPMAPKTVIVADTYTLFVSSISSLIYPLILVLGTWYIVLRGISYGPMQHYDEMTTENEVTTTEPSHKACMADFIIPIAVLISAIVLLMLYTGNAALFGGTATLLEALKEASVQIALGFGGMIALAFACIYSVARGILPTNKLAPTFMTGIWLMLPSIMMLICAWSLGALLRNDLKTGTYIAQLVCSSLTIELLPVTCYIFSAVIAILLGSAWATIGLMFPIVVDMLQTLLGLPYNTPVELVPLIVPIIGATLSGAVWGVHMSVISDNPIMSAASTGANHLEHVKTMIWYVLPIGISAAIGFAVIGTMGTLSWVLPVAISISIAWMIALLELGQWLFHKPV